MLLCMMPMVAVAEGEKREIITALEAAIVTLGDEGFQSFIIFGKVNASRSHIYYAGSTLLLGSDLALLGLTANDKLRLKLLSGCVL